MLCDECGEPIEHDDCVRVGSYHLHKDRCEIRCGYCQEYVVKGERAKVGTGYFHDDQRCSRAKVASSRREVATLLLAGLTLLWQVGSPVLSSPPDENNRPSPALGHRKKYVYDLVKGLDESLVGTSDRATGWIVSKDCACVIPRELRLWRGAAQ